ncbi:MAG TPA: TlpA disulfide reductase family protein [Magnetovibrio sp.]
MPSGAPSALAQKLLEPKSGEGAFDTPFFNAKEEPLTLNSLKGQGVVLNFWATWCAPCVREMPALDSLAAKLEGTGVRVVAVSEDRNALEKVPPFLNEKGITQLDLFFDRKGALSRKLGVEGLPTTILIDAQGREFGRVKGVLEWGDDAIVAYLTQVLAPR